MFNAPEQLGKYQLFKRLAVGGMAEVYVGRAAGPAGFSKLVAVKRIHPHLATSEAFVEMFLDEARLAAQLDHPNIVQLIDLGQAGDDYFLAMEFIRGKTLRQVIDRTHELGQPLDLQAVLTIALGVLNALRFAHGRRGPDGQLAPVVHRDVSPQNILVGYNGTVKLADFGIAKAQDRVHVTNAGVVKGKAYYMAPEQMFEGKADARADIFACGAVFHEMLTGRRLFGQFSQSELFNPSTRKEVVAPSAVLPSRPPALDPIVLRMLERRVEARYGSCSEVIAALEECMLGLRAMGSTERLAASMRTLFAIELEQEERDLATWAQQTGLMPQAGPSRSPAPVLAPSRPMRPRGLQPLESKEVTAPQRPVAWPELPTMVRGVDDAPTQAHVSSPTPHVHQAATQLHGALLVPLAPRPRRVGLWAALVGGAVSSVALATWALWPPAEQPSQPVLSYRRDAGTRTSADAGRRVALRVDPPPRVDTPTTRPVDPPSTQRSPATTPAFVRKKRRPHPRSASGTLELQSTPSSLDVYLGRRHLGRTPLGTRVSAGRHHLRLRSGSLGINTTASVRVSAGRTTREHLRIGRGRLRVNGVPWAQVYVDGREIGVTPLRVLSLYAGKHLVELRHPPSRGRMRRWIQVTEGGNHLVMHDFRQGSR